MEKFHKSVQKILSLLRGNNVWFETFEHEPVTTSIDASKLRHGYALSQGAKALILRIKYRAGEESFVQMVIPGDARLDSKKAKVLLEARDIRFATAEEISRLTEGIQIGGIPPFGNLFGISVYVDRTLLENVKIIFNGGDRRFSIGMYAKDYLRLINPTTAEFIVA